VEVMSPIVLGGATLGAAGLNFLHEGRKAKRFARETGTSRRWWRRPLMVMALAVTMVGGWFAYTAGGLERIGLRAPRIGRARVTATPTKPDASARPPVAPPSASAAAVLLPGAPGKREDWLQSEGLKLYYRFSRYLPDACPGNPIAIGNWVEGEARPVVASCVDEEWLAVDFAPLVADGRIVPNMTYCMNFRAESGAWGVHVPDKAPGIDSVVVPAVKVPLGRAVGLRYVKGLRERVVPTAEPPRAAC
ncbi:MAG: hypothetical protein ACREMA_20920, partial [Longimicrobiales bacterium]